MPIKVFRPNNNQDPGVKKYSLQQITFTYDEKEENPTLSIMVTNKNLKSELINKIGMHQTIAESDGQGRIEFLIHEDRPEIVLEGNLANAITILKKIQLISQELGQEILKDKDLAYFLDTNKLFELAEIDTEQKHLSDEGNLHKVLKL